MRKRLLVGLGVAAALVVARAASVWQGPSCEGKDPALVILPSIVEVYSSEGEGTGFIIDKSHGLIVTARHVVANNRGSIVDVVFRDNVRTKARIVHSEPVSDISVLQVSRPEFPELKPATLPSQAKMLEAARLQRIPLEIESVVAAGYVETEYRSQLGRTRAVVVDNAGKIVIEGAGRISPGMSGGPLVNQCGDLLGILSMGAEIAAAVGDEKSDTFAAFYIDAGDIENWTGATVRRLTPTPAPSGALPFIGNFIQDIVGRVGREKAMQEQGDQIQRDAFLAKGALPNGKPYTPRHWLDDVHKAQDKADTTRSIQDIMRLIIGRVTNDARIQAVNDYFTLRKTFEMAGGTFDREGWQDAREDFLLQLDKPLRDAVVEATSASTTPTVVAYYRLLDKARPYFDVERQVIGPDPELRALYEQHKAANPREQSVMRAKNPRLALAVKRIADERKRIRLTNTDVDLYLHLFRNGTLTMPENIRLAQAGKLTFAGVPVPYTPSAPTYAPGVPRPPMPPQPPAIPFAPIKPPVFAPLPPRRFTPDLPQRPQRPQRPQFGPLPWATPVGD